MLLACHFSLRNHRTQHNDTQYNKVQHKPTQKLYKMLERLDMGTESWSQFHKTFLSLIYGFSY
jgi:hypothetical protein